MHPQSHNQLLQDLQIRQLILKDESILTGQVGVNIPPPPPPLQPLYFPAQISPHLPIDAKKGIIPL